MTIQDLIDQFEIQGAYCIKRWIEKDNDYVVLIKGDYFECEYGVFKHINKAVLNAKIAYMYAVDVVLNIEVE